MAVYDKDDNLIYRFEYADGRMPVSMTDASGKRYYLHYDQVGSLRAVSDSNHNIVKEITYDTFGNILSDSNPSFKVPFRFAGGLYDPNTLLTHFGFREYDAFTGKWTAKDPILFAGGDSNLYGYVLGDPVNLVDPWGLASIFDILIPDTLNSGEEEELAKIRKNIKRWRYQYGEIKPIDPKTGKPNIQKTKCYTETPKHWDPPLSPAQKPPSGGEPKTIKQKALRLLEILLRMTGHWK